MRARPLLIAFLAALFCGILHADLPAGRQTVALFPPHALGVEDGTRVSVLLGQALADLLRSRFDVHLVTGKEGSDPVERKRKARSLGATYVLTGNVSRIGHSATLDLTLAPTEDPGKGRTVFVTSEGESTPAQKEQTTGTGDLPPAFRRMADEAAARLTLLFFGDGQIGEGREKKTIPSLSGKISRSRNIPGKIVSLAKGDVDRNGKPEIAAAYPDAIVIYGLTGEELVEKARIPESRGGLFHVDVADLNRNGIAEVIAVRYLSGRAVSDVWEFDGKEYKRIAADIPYFLRAADMGPEGIVLLGQESDPVTIFKGPVFRMVLERGGSEDMRGRGAPIPLPPGTWVYSFVPVHFRGEARYVALDEGGRLLLLDGKGEKVWQSIDAVLGAETVLSAALGKGSGLPGNRNVRRLSLPGRLFAADLDGDKSDEIIVVNNIVSAGGFFENLRIFTNAEVLCFGQEEGQLALAWRTPQIESPAMDAFLDVPYGGRPFRVGIASHDKAKILGTFGEWRLYWVN
ncbi:MAG: hypothetical protein WBX49_00450 [Candidatus Deferrimicrobiaceae bacterium]